MRKKSKRSKTGTKGRRSRRHVAQGAAFAVVIVALSYFAWSMLRRPHTDFEAVLTSGSAAGFNVVVVTLDTTRADRVGCYGYTGAETPVLDRLAAEGIRFADAVSSVPLTLPAHASIFTGLDPSNHGVRNNGEYRLDASQTTLAEVLQEHGYDTAAFVSAFVLDARFGLDQGFVRYDDRVDAAPGGKFGSLESQRSAGAVTEAALGWLRTRQRQDPFFLWVHYYDPHDPYMPPSVYADHFRASPYDGEIAYMDAQIGRLINALERAPAPDRTVVFIVGDHGESLGERHERTHARLIYEDTQHVPLIVWCPALVQGPYLVDDVVVGICDIFPTVLDLLEIAHEGPSDGVSLLRCREHPNRMLYMETMVTYLENGWAPLHGIRRHKDKYIFAPTPEYYDLQADSGELNNLLLGRLSPDAETAVAELRAELAARMKDSPSAESVAAAAMELDPQALRRLQSLGYVSGEVSGDSDELPDPKDMMPTWERLEEAKKLRNVGRYSEALAIVNQVLTQWPTDQSVLRELGMIYLGMDRREEAEQAFRKYTEIRPNPDVYILLFEITIRARRFAEAKEFLRQAVSLEPNHGGVIIAQGDWMAVHRRDDEARRFYEKAKRVDPYRAVGVANRRLAKIAKRPGG